MRKLVTTASAFALCVSMITAPANAAVTVLDQTPAANPGAVELDGMQDQCDYLASLHDTGNGDLWTGEVVLGAVTYVSGPTESGTHSIDDAIGDPVGAGTFTPAHTEIEGDPYRNGGSVNMFGDAVAVGGHYSASTYDFMGLFETTYSHAYSCNIFKQQYYPEETIHHPAVGVYVVAGDFGESEAAIRGNCEAFSANTTAPWFGELYRGGTASNPHCMFVGDQAWDETIEEHYGDKTLMGNEAADAIEVTQTDPLLAHEDAGEGFDTDETLWIGQVVVCISPSSTGKKLPGDWVAKNGYDGSKCTRAWYDGGAKTNVSNLNTGSHNWVTVPLS